MNQVGDLLISVVGDAVSEPYDRVREFAGPVATFRDGYIGDVSLCVREFRIRER